MTFCVAQSLRQLPVLLDWTALIFIALITGSQFLGIGWNSSSTSTRVVYGRSPDDVPRSIPGLNDEAFADRSIVCQTQGRFFEPMQASSVLADKKLAPVVNSTRESLDGFRVVTRDQTMHLEPVARDYYTELCKRVSETMESIQDSCDALGYSVARDTLRLLNGLDTDIIQGVTRALPVLIVPYWDNAMSFYAVIPGMDGSACVFRLSGSYQMTTLNYSIFKGVSRATRELQTAEWLNKPGGSWRNGWYDAPDSTRWFSNMASANYAQSYGIIDRQFDTTLNREINCRSTNAAAVCEPGLVIETWGQFLMTTSQLTKETLVFITNGSRFGYFLFDAISVNTTHISYSIATFISNCSIFAVLVRWFVSLMAMAYSNRRGISQWQSSSVGCLSNSRTFNMLPLLLLSRIKTILCVFFTTGCNFEGQQSAFANSWFIMYPGLIEFTFYFFSLLNVVAKITYRRMSDILFVPTLLVLWGLHYFRIELASSGLFGLDKRISTLILSSEVEALVLTDFVTTNVALRLNGNARPIYYFKIGILFLNLLPLVFAENMTNSRGTKLCRFSPCEIESVLAVRAASLGRSPIYDRRVVQLACDNSVMPLQKSMVLGSAASREELSRRTDTGSRRNSIMNIQGPTLGDSSGSSHVLLGYEMNRLGYLVFGGMYLISYDDWYVLTSMAPLRAVEKLWNFRVIVFDVEREAQSWNYFVVGPPRLCRLDDPQLRAIRFYEVTICNFK